MVTRGLRDCFDLNFYILYSLLILYITLCYKNYVTNMENREEIQLSLTIVRHYIVMKLMSRKDCTAGNLILLITNA